MSTGKSEGIAPLSIGELVVISNMARNGGTEGRIAAIDPAGGTITVSTSDWGKAAFTNLRANHGYSPYSWLAENEKGESFNVERIPGEISRGSWLDYTDEPGDGLFGRRGPW